MKYTRRTARHEARKLTRSGVKHSAIPSRYWSVNAEQWVSCWTVVLGGKRS